MKYRMTTAETKQVASGRANKVLLTVTAGWTGTIVVIDNTTGSSADVCTITNPVKGESYEFWDFTRGVRVISTGTLGEVVINVDQGRSSTK